MGISKSQVELAGELDKALESPFPDAGQFTMHMSEMIDRDCFHCHEDIGNTERPFFWMGTSFIVMHQRCFIDWLGRVLRDAEQARNELFNTATLNGTPDAEELS